MRFLVLFVYFYLANAEIMETNVINNDINEGESSEEVLPNRPKLKVHKRYRPNWDDLDTRPLPQWYDKAKIGIFLHWGVYCVPSFGSEWFWSNWKGGKQEKIVDYMEKNYPPGFTYQEFAPMFRAEFFDAEAWAKLFAKAGAKYVVLTSKHHEGFTMFPSKRSFSWNAVDIGPKRDIVAELSKAVRKQDLKFGLYHSLYEWFNPIYTEDKKAGFKTQTYVETKLWPDIKQLVDDYRPSVIWSDGDWEATDTYWGATQLLAWLYNDSPIKEEIVVNDRWGIGIPGKHGDFFNYADRYNPGKLLQHKWENAFTIDKLSWGYRRNMQLHEILSFEELLYQIVSTVSCGGNALINVGPTKEGTLAPIFQERLLTLGSWLSINGEAIYGTSPWQSQNDTLTGDIWYTCIKTTYNATYPTALPAESDKISAIYAILLSWPATDTVRVKDVMALLHSGNYKVEMLGNEGDYLKWKITNGEVDIKLPSKAAVKSEYAWTLRFTLK